MKIAVIGVLALSSMSAWAAGPSTATPIFRMNDVRATSPFKVEFSVMQANGSPTLDKSRPIVQNLYVEVLNRSATATSTSTKGKKAGGSSTPGGSTSTGPLASIAHYVYPFGETQTWMGHKYLDNGASHQQIVYFGKTLTLESSDLSGRAVTVRLVEEYTSGKKLVATSIDVDMPTFSGDNTAPEIDPVDALQGFVSSGTAANGYTISTRPGTFFKDDVGVKYAEIFVNGVLRGTASYGQQMPNETYALGDSEIGSRYHVYESERGEAYYFQIIPGIFSYTSTMTIQIKAFDFAGNVSQKTVSYPK